jgi:hypothetical protein
VISLCDEHDDDKLFFRSFFATLYNFCCGNLCDYAYTVHNREFYTIVDMYHFVLYVIIFRLGRFSFVC